MAETGTMFYYHKKSDLLTPGRPIRGATSYVARTQEKEPAPAYFFTRPTMCPSAWAFGNTELIDSVLRFLKKFDSLENRYDRFLPKIATEEIRFGTFGLVSVFTEQYRTDHRAM
jgi:hypothetical protein